MNKWPGLNILRGIAALMIVIHHANVTVIPFLPKATGIAGFIIARTRNLGWSGIDLFFVLGGFLMGATLLKESAKGSGIDVAAYWKRRAKRIIPSYYFLLIVLAITGVTGYIDFSSAHSALRGILIHFLFLNNYLDQLPNGPMWYLAAMVQLYLVVPLLLIALYRTTKQSIMHTFPLVAIGGAVVVFSLRCWKVFSGAHEPNDFMLTHFRVDTVLIGMLALYLLRVNHPIVDRIRSHSRLSACLGALLVAPCTFLPRTDPYMFTVGFTSLALGYSILIIVIATYDLDASRVARAFLLAISAWSYNIYLWHYFVPSIVGNPYAQSQLLIHSVTQSVNMQVVVQIVMFTVVSVIVGFLMTNLIEKTASKRISL